MTAASQCSCETMQQYHFEILLHAACHNMMVRATRSSTSTQTACPIAWAGKCLLGGVQEISATVKRNQETVKDQTPWLWDTWFLQTAPCGICDRYFTTREKDLSYCQAGSLQTQELFTLWSSLKASHMAFCSCFHPPCSTFSPEDGAPGHLLERAQRKGSLGATPFSYLYQQHYCNSSTLFYI